MKCFIRLLRTAVNYNKPDFENFDNLTYRLRM